MYWVFAVIVLAIAFLCGLMIGYLIGGDQRHEQR